MAILRNKYDTMYLTFANHNQWANRNSNRCQSFFSVNNSMLLFLPRSLLVPFEINW